MRILHVTPSFYPAWAYGGVPRCAYELCRALVRRGAEVTVWTTDVLDATQRLREPTTRVDGIQVERFANLSNRLAYHMQLYLPRGLWSHARRRVSEFDLVHLHSHRHLLEPLVAGRAQRAGVPHVCTANGTVPIIERFARTKRVVDALGARAILTRAACCIAVSAAEVGHLRAAGVTPGRIRVIPNGVCLDEFATLPARGGFRRTHELGDVPLVLFLGKITPRKGLDVLIRAFRQLPSDVHLVVAGNFMMPVTAMHGLTEELGVARRVRYVGLLSGEQKLAAYVDADVLAYPSVHEIFGLVPFEALMCGVPVVVCDDSGCGEVVRAAGGGLLVPYGDAAALATALRTLLEDPALRRECATRGRQYVEQYLGWDAIAARTLALYEEIAAPPCRPASASAALMGAR